MTAQGFTGPTVAISDVDGLQEELDTKALSLRLLGSGETVIPRSQVTVSSGLESGTLFVTHFTAERTETIESLRTGTGGAGTVAVGTTGAWIGILGWDGTDYTPVAASANDTAMWSAQFTEYDKALPSPWSKVKGEDYAMFLLWIGSGQAPSLPASGGWYQDSLIAPRMNALLFSQTGPPAAPISGAFFGPDSRRFQALMLP